MRTFSDEHRANLSKAKKGKSFSDEHKHNISLARRGTKQSDETKRKIAVAQNKRWIKIREDKQKEFDC